MTTRASNIDRGFGRNLVSRRHPCVASDIVFAGSAVGDNGSGYARPLAAGDNFLGFCRLKADNSSGAAGAIQVDIESEGEIHLPTIAGASGLGDVGSAVYASDDDTFTLTKTGNSHIGHILGYDGTDFLVRFAAKTPAAAVAAAVVAHDVNATFSDTEVEAALDALGGKINALIAVMEAAGIVVPNS